MGATGSDLYLFPGTPDYNSKINLNRNVCIDCFMNTFMKSHGLQKGQLWNKEVS